MAVTASQLIAKVSDQGADITAQKMRNVGASVDDAGSKIRNFAMGAAVVGTAALVGIGMASVKMAGDFQSEMTSLVTGAGESESNLKLVSDGILNMAAPVGTTTKQLSDGMYLIESSGQHGAQALQTLKDAAMGAKVGSADLGTVANGVTTIMTDYASANISSAQATNTLIATVAAGKTHMGDLAASLAMILPTASAAGVSLTDVSAAMATMTGEGTPAADASTYLRQTIMSLVNPASKGAQALADIGLKAEDVSQGIKKSLPDTLKLITDHLKQKFPEGSAAYVAALADIAGGSKQMQGMLQMTGDHLSVFQGNVVSITDSVTKGGNSITGWSKVQGDFNFKMDQAKATLETLGIKIGTALLPVLGRLMDGFSSPAFQSFASILAGNITVALLGVVNGVTTLVNVGANLTSFFQHNQVALAALQPVLTSVAGIIGGLLVFAFWNWATAATAAAIAMLPLLGTLAPFIAVGALVGLVVGGIILAVTHWSEISKTLQSDWQTFQGWYQGFLGDVQSKWNTAIGGLKSKGEEFISWFNTWKPIIEGVGGAITLFFLPVLIQAGVSAVVSGAQMTANFIQAMIMVGTQSAVSGAQMTANFIASTVRSGVSAVISGAQMAASFIPSIINSGIVSVIAAAQITGNFIRSIIMTGVEGWQAASKLALFIGQIVLTGIRSVATGAMMVISFVAGLISAGVQATISAGIFLATLVPSLLAVAAGVIAATWPFLAIGAVVALVVAGIVLAVQHWGDITKWFQGFWQASLQVVSDVFTAIWNGIQSFFQAAINFIINTAKIGALVLFVAITGPFGLAALFIISHWSQVQDAIKSGIDFMSSVLGGIESIVITYLVKPFEDGLGTIGGVFFAIGSLIKDATSFNWGAIPGDLHALHIPGFASGTDYAPGGLAKLGEFGTELVTGPSVGYLPQGSRVYSASQTAQMMSGSYASGGGGQPVIFQIDGRTFARGYMPYHVEAIRNGAGVRF